MRVSEPQVAGHLVVAKSETHRGVERPGTQVQLETTARIGNYDWKLRFILECGLSGNRTAAPGAVRRQPLVEIFRVAEVVPGVPVGLPEVQQVDRRAIAHHASSVVRWPGRTARAGSRSPRTRQGANLGRETARRCPLGCLSWQGRIGLAIHAPQVLHGPLGAVRVGCAHRVLWGPLRAVLSPSARGAVGRQARLALIFGLAFSLACRAAVSDGRSEAVACRRPLGADRVPGNGTAWDLGDALPIPAPELHLGAVVAGVAVTLVVDLSRRSPAPAGSAACKRAVIRGRQCRWQSW
jgi:hypothetical protein